MNISASAWPVQLEVFKVQTKAHPPFSRKLVLLFMLMLISSLSKKVHAVVLNISTAFKLVMNWSIASHKMPLPVQFTNDHQFKQLNFVKAVWKTWCFLPKSENWHLGIQRKLSQFPGQLGNIMFLSSGILFWQFQLFRILAKWFLTIGLYGSMALWLHGGWSFLHLDCIEQQTLSLQQPVVWFFGLSYRPPFLISLNNQR